MTLFLLLWAVSASGACLAYVRRAAAASARAASAAADASSAEAGLARLRAAGEAAFEGLRDGLVVFDHEGRVAAMNGSAAAVLGSERAGTVGRSSVEVLRSTALQTLLAASVDRTEPVDVEPAGPGSGTVSAYSVRLPPPGGTLLVLSDVTELRRGEAIRRDFVANVSHELRTPMTSIRAAAETLSDGALSDPNAAKTFVTVIGRQAERLGRIFDDLLTLSKLESGTGTDEALFTEESLGAVLGDAAEACADRADRRGVSVRVSCPADLRVRTNRGLLSQAFANLIDNALKYSPPHGIVTVEAGEAAGGASVTVTDRGRGIPAVHQGRVFERFYRVDPSRGRDDGGVGLGLSIVKHICQVHGGGVSLESEAGRGSRFTVRLPLAGRERRAAGTGGGSSGLTRRPGGGEERRAREDVPGAGEAA